VTAISSRSNEVGKKGRRLVRHPKEESRYAWSNSLHSKVKHQEGTRLIPYRVGEKFFNLRGHTALNQSSVTRRKRSDLSLTDRSGKRVSANGYLQTIKKGERRKKALLYDCLHHSRCSLMNESTG